jgi:ribonucleoside-diphosphate reductase beta chain
MSQSNILNPGFNLNLRPMRYPQFYLMYKAAIRNTWTVDEIDFSRDIPQLKLMSPAERHMIQRLVAFFATGDSIVANNLVLNLYKNINSPEARMYLSRQLYEEALHIQFYLTLLDTYIPDINERHAAFAAVNDIPSIARKALWMAKWSETDNPILNIVAFAACVEGLFFMGAFAYVYYLKSRGMLPGLADGTNWVFRDEVTGHMEFAFAVLDVIEREQPGAIAKLQPQIVNMIASAVDIEADFAKDALSGGVMGLSPTDMRQYLEHCADQRLVRLGLPAEYGSKNPFPFMEHHGMQSLSNFFERRVADYQIGITGTVTFDEKF